MLKGGGIGGEMRGEDHLEGRVSPEYTILMQLSRSEEEGSIATSLMRVPGLLLVHALVLVYGLPLVLALVLVYGLPLVLALVLV